jgi:hypothetical protein
VAKVTAKIKTRSKPTPSENFNSHPLLNMLRSTVKTVVRSDYYFRKLINNNCQNDPFARHC